MTTSLLRIAAATSAALALLAAAPMASAHDVVLDQPEAAAGSFHKLVLNIGHGCEQSATTTVRVLVPEGVHVARPQPKAGWTVALKQEKLAKPVSIGHGQTADEIVREVAWTGGRVPTEQFEEFRLIVKLPDRSGTMLPIPVVQECERGELRWTEVPATGQSAHGLKYPAPALKLLPAGHAHH